jgi:hypothetical protein
MYQPNVPQQQTTKGDACRTAQKKLESNEVMYNKKSAGAL